MGDELVEVWRQEDGTWRWRYLVVEDHWELRSNRGYESVEEAIVSARRAYPGVQVLGPTGYPASLDGASPHRGGMLRVVVVSSVAVFASLAVWAAWRQARRRTPRRR